MVTHASNSKTRSDTGLLMVELLVAMAIIIIAIIPLAGLYMAEGRLARGYYYRSVAMEVVDGEMEVLLAGEWQAHPVSTTNYPLPEMVRSNLPAGNLSLTVTNRELRLEWTPVERGRGGAIIRTGRIPK